MSDDLSPITWEVVEKFKTICFELYRVKLHTENIDQAISSISELQKYLIWYKFFRLPWSNN